MSTHTLNDIPNGIINSEINLIDLIEEAKKELKSRGYYIAEKLIDKSCYAECRKQSLCYFKDLIFERNNIKIPYALRGGVPVGIKDFAGYSNNKSWHIYRYCHFPWNRADEKISIVFTTSQVLSMIRNILNGDDISYGNFIENNNYITYSSLSLYPSNGGYLAKHKDHQPTLKNPTLIHTKLELTHKGSDYKQGGFYFYDRNGDRVDISSLVNPSDVIFFDGTEAHEITPIARGGIGRIAVFNIPTYVTKSSRVNTYAGDGFSLPRKVLTKIAGLLP